MKTSKKSSFLNTPYRRSLHNINLASGLLYIAKGSIHIWNQIYVHRNYGPRYQHTEQIRGVEHISTPYNLSLLVYLASEIIANSRSRTWPFTIDRFNEGIRFLNSNIQAIEKIKDANKRFRPIQLAMAQVHAQMPLAEMVPMFNRFSRYDLLFNDIGKRDGMGAIPKLLGHFTNFQTGLSIREFMATGKLIFGLSLRENGELNLENIQPIDFGEVTIGREQVERFLSIVATEPNTFKSKMIRSVSEELRQHTPLNPLLRFPIILFESRYFVPVPQLLFERCAIGIYDDFREKLVDGEKERFCADFGLVFEKYNEYIISRTNADWNVWPEQEYNGMKSCDVIVWDGNTLVLIECKTTRLNERTKTWMSQEKYERELKEIAHGMEAIVRTYKHLINAKFILNGLEVNDICNVRGIVVTLDEYFLNPTSNMHIVSSDGGQTVKLPNFRKVIRSHLFDVAKNYIDESTHITWQDLENIGLDNIQVMSIDAFEQHLATYSPGSELVTLVDDHPPISIHPILYAHYSDIWRNISPAETST